jgi:hypothetical protein
MIFPRPLSALQSAIGQTTFKEGPGCSAVLRRSLAIAAPNAILRNSMRRNFFGDQPYRPLLPASLAAYRPETRVLTRTVSSPIRLPLLGEAMVRESDAHQPTPHRAFLVLFTGGEPDSRCGAWHVWRIKPPGLTRHPCFVSDLWSLSPPRGERDKRSRTKFVIFSMFPIFHLRYPPLGSHRMPPLRLRVCGTRHAAGCFCLQNSLRHSA